MGSGKTSFVNLARGYIEDSDVTILDFNPWMFSGAEQLVESFFIELSAQLKVRAGFGEVGKLLEDYGESFSGLGWLPLVGPWIERGRTATQVPSLFSQLELLTKIGYLEGAGHKLVSEAAAKTLEKEWRARVRVANADTLAGEHELLRILYLTKREADPDESALAVPESPRVTHALLRSARSEVRSQSVGSRAMHRSPRLAWNPLVELFGDEVILRQRIEALKASQPDEIGDLLTLAEKYLDGWRPDDFGED